jgi:hypothetical protein
MLEPTKKINLLLARQKQLFLRLKTMFKSNIFASDSNKAKFLDSFKYKFLS